MTRPGGWDSPDPGRTRTQSGRQPCWDMLESGTGSARSFTSEPGIPQGEEGLASRASRHENPEALVLLHSSHIFIQSSVLRKGVSWEKRGGDTPPAPSLQGQNRGHAAQLRQAQE